jgi:DNA helicase-2/ATP-dependent DNA helicase PcrA
LIDDRKASLEWLQDALQEPIRGVPDAGDDDGAPIDPFSGGTPAEAALGVWSLARNRMEPLAVAYERASRGWGRNLLPKLEFVEQIVERYESAKRLDHRCDFTDLLALYAGVRFDPEGPTEIAPSGEVPDVHTWFLDEQQDSSALLDRVCKRLVSKAQWVYVTGDPFQAVYDWAGADSTHMLQWPIGEGKRRVMPKSYRCGPKVMALGESILQRCDDYWDRKIEPAEHESSVELWGDRRGLSAIDPSESWLLLARTNFQARYYAGQLNAAAIPWLPTKGNGTWSARQRHAGMRALYAIERGDPVDGDQWRLALKLLPANLDKQPLLARGTKARFEDERFDAAGEFPFVLPNQLDQLGATPLLSAMIADGRWRKIKGIEPAMYLQALERWGQEAIESTRIRVGTIHSVKGSEADNVVLCTAISKPIAFDLQYPWGVTSEARVWYVAVTRARRRLIILDELRERFRYRVA